MATMVRAFVMVKTSAGESGAVQGRLSGRDGIHAAHVVAGTYDVIAEAEAEDVYSVINAVATDVHGLDGVVDTRTYICLE
jgi:DNA-binding Lrp family transcriptional regulator